MTTQETTRVVTPEAMISYPFVWEPYAGKDGTDEPKYSASFVFPQGTDLSALQRAALTAGLAKWGDKFKEMLQLGQIRMPFRTDWAAKGYPEGSTFINARSKNKPGIVLPTAGADGKPMELTDRDQLFAGCIVRASVTSFAYDRNGNKGVSFALNNIQYLRTGERLDNRVPAKDEFGPVDETPVPMSGDPLADIASML